MSWQQMHRVGDRLTPSLRRELEEAFRRARGRVPVTVIERVIRNSALGVVQTSRLMQALPAILDAVVKPALRQSTSKAAQLARVELSAELGAAPALDIVNELAVHAANTQSAALVTRVTAQTRRAIQTVITSALRDGYPPRDAAKLIRTMVGLTQRQAGAVVRYRGQLLTAGLTREAASARVDKYAARLLRQRAEMIARTEIVDSLTTGQQLSWQEARNRGMLPQNVRQRWIVTPDDRLCPLCAQMVGARAITVLGGYFDTPLGPKRGPTMHPHCRCGVVLDTKSLRLRTAA